MTSSFSLALAEESRVPRVVSAARLDSVMLYSVVGVLLFGPLAFGAVEPWSLATMQVSTGLFFALWAARQVADGELEIVSNPLFLPMFSFAALILWQLETGRTAYRAGTLSAARLYFTYGLLCFLGVQCLRKTSQVKTIAWLLSGYGFTVAMFSLIQGIASNGKLYWLRSLPSDGWIYGPYVNHNHYAGLMEMLTPIPLVIALSPVSISRKALAALAAAVMASTIFLSGSRGGMAAFLVQMVLLATFLIKRGRTGKAPIALGAFLIAMLGLLTWLGGEELSDRMISLQNAPRTDLSAATRLRLDGDALKMFAQKPVLGWGFGVFGEIYPKFSTLSSNKPVGMAHNDYLQLLVEMGGLGFLTMSWFLLTLFRCAFKKFRHCPRDTNTAVALAATLGLTGILVHSFVDFNMHIPSNAALFYVFCTVAAMEPRTAAHHATERLDRSRVADGSAM